MLQKGIPVRYQLVKSRVPWKWLEIVFQSVVQFIRTLSCLLVIFSSKRPTKTLYLPPDKGPLYSWTFAIPETLNWDSGVLKSFLK